ncbi:MAG: glutathione S-transferase family protein [Gammaproteobacteria bacterium]|nr:glutathione S-transferase family protein [Gammaproteobacteria bacterium]
MDIELYYTPQTRSGRVRWALEELDMPYTLRPIDLFGGERNPAHPLGMVPAMTVDGEKMFESGAMCMWLADQSLEHRLAPRHTDPQRRAYEQWMFFGPATLEPPAFELLLHTRILPEDMRVPEITGFAGQGYRRVLDMLTTHFKNNDYLLGDTFSGADIVVGHTLTWLPELIAPYPPLLAYVERLTARPAYQRAMQPVDADNTGGAT